MDAIRDTILCQSKGNIVVDWLVGLPFIVLILLFSPIVAFAFAIFATTADLLGSSNSFLADATHVPTFYVPKHGYSRAFRIFFLGALGSIFGAIHCAGWNFQFPTYVEQQLWRTASLVVTTPIAAAPVALIAASIGFIVVFLTIGLIWIILAVAFVAIVIIAYIIAILVACFIDIIIGIITCYNIDTDIRTIILEHDIGVNLNALDTLIDCLDRLTKPIRSLFATFSSSDFGAFDMVVIFYMLAYASSRLVLLGLALSLLGHQPLSAFVTVDWVKFYPHIL